MGKPTPKVGQEWMHPETGRRYPKRAPSNWATFMHLRNPSAPRADEKPPKPEVLPTVSPEELAQRAERERHIREILEACDD